MIDLFPYTGNLTWLDPVLLVNHGSTAYGTSTPASDLDIKGVAIPPRNYFLGFNQVFEQAESHKPDMVVYDIRKFFKLAAECNPNIIEVLWVDESDVRICTDIGRRLMDARELFLSKKAKFTFSGYAWAQLKRIKTHRRWLVTPPKSPPTRADLGLPEHTIIPRDQLEAAHAAVSKKLASWNLEDMSGIEPAERIRLQEVMAEMVAELSVTTDEKYQAAGRSIGFEENFLRLLDLERRYKAGKTEWDQYQNWIATRNPARAELEAKYGFDTKHGGHLYRLMMMCREILETHKVIVKRPDREHILGIRNGMWSCDQLIEWAEKQEKEMDAVYQASTLRHSCDRVALDRLCVELVEASWSQ